VHEIPSPVEARPETRSFLTDLLKLHPAIRIEITKKQAVVFIDSDL
jgi:hypothetical protein